MRIARSFSLGLACVALLASGWVGLPCVARADIPPLTEVIATPGSAPQSVDLRWLTPLFDSGGSGNRDRTVSYEFRYSQTYLTTQNFSSGAPLLGGLPDVEWQGLLDVDLTLDVQAGNDGGQPAYMVYWDQAYLRVWLTLGWDSPRPYGVAGVGLANEKVDIRITKDGDPSWEITNTLSTDQHGYAEWDTGDICNDSDGDWYTFTATWSPHEVTLRNGMVIRSAEGAEDSYRMWMTDDSDGVVPPSNLNEGGVTQSWDMQDCQIVLFFPAGAVSEDSEIAVSEPLGVPGPDGMLPNVPGAMVAFQVDKSSGPELLVPAEISVRYPPSRLEQYGGVAECALAGYRYDEGRGLWILLPEMLVIDRIEHTVTFATSTLGLLAIAAETDADRDGVGNLQELEWGTVPAVLDTDGDGTSDGDEIWWSGGDATDPLQVHGSDQHGLGEDLIPLERYWIAGRIVSERDASPVSRCAYLGPPIEPSYALAWEGPPLFKSDAAWGDFDGDGDPDLALCGESGGAPITRTYANSESGLQERQQLTGVWNEGSGGLAWGDYDADGDLDLAVAGMGATQPFAGIYANDGAGTLTLDPAVTLTPVSYASLAWADVDADLDLDLLLLGYDGTAPVTVLYRNGPPGTLTPDTLNALTGLYAGSADWGDLDNDGDLDLLLTGSDGAQRRTIFYQNHPAGWLRAGGNHGLPDVALSDAEWGDLDRDGDADLAFTGETMNAVRCARIYRNDAGTLTLLADLLPIYRSSCALGDVDLDGDLDAAFCGYTGTDLQTCLFQNNGAGFDPMPFFFPGVREGSLALVDPDRDGDCDFFLTGADWGSGYAQLYENGGIVASVAEQPVLPAKLAVEFANPSPAGSALALRCRLPRAGVIELGIFDVAGRCQRTLAAGPADAGEQVRVWDGRDGAGRPLASGVYACRLKSGGELATKRLVRVR